MIELPIEPHDIRVPLSAGGGVCWGHKVIFDYRMVDRTEDWSKVRSPGRARRRQKLGHRQRIRSIVTPNLTVTRYEGHEPVLIMHPAAWPKLMVQMGLENDFVQRAERAGLSVKMAQKVRAVWRRLGRAERDILVRTGRMAIMVEERNEPSFLRGPDAVVPGLRSQMEILTGMALSDGRLAIVWNNLIIDEIRL